jgi:hypothetical protein
VDLGIERKTIKSLLEDLTGPDICRLDGLPSRRRLRDARGAAFALGQNAKNGVPRNMSASQLTPEVLTALAAFGLPIPFGTKLEDIESEAQKAIQAFPGELASLSVKLPP